MKVTKCDRCGVECGFENKTFLCTDLSSQEVFRTKEMDLCYGCAAALIDFLKNKEFIDRA